MLRHLRWVGGRNPFEQVKDVAQFPRLTGFFTKPLALLISSERKFEFRLNYKSGEAHDAAPFGTLIGPTLFGVDFRLAPKVLPIASYTQSEQHLLGTLNTELAEIFFSLYLGFVWKDDTER